MSKSLACVTPAVVVLLASPVFLVLAPDGIPFAYAGCGQAAGDASAVTITRCTDCGGAIEWIDTHSCSLTKSPYYCSMTATVVLSAESYDGCDTTWFGFCGGITCVNGEAGTSGDVTNQPTSKTLDCAADGDSMLLQLGGANGCDCSVDGSDQRVFIGIATCQR